MPDHDVAEAARRSLFAQEVARIGAPVGPAGTPQIGSTVKPAIYREETV